MASSASKTSTRGRGRTCRVRGKGGEPIRRWRPDVNAPAFAAEVQRQAQTIAHGHHEADDQAFVDAIAVDWGHG